MSLCINWTFHNKVSYEQWGQLCWRLCPFNYKKRNKDNYLCPLMLSVGLHDSMSMPVSWEHSWHFCQWHFGLGKMMQLGKPFFFLVFSIRRKWHIDIRSTNVSANHWLLLSRDGALILSCWHQLAWGCYRWYRIWIRWTWGMGWPGLVPTYAALLLFRMIFLGLLWTWGWVTCQLWGARTCLVTF